MIDVFSMGGGHTIQPWTKVIEAIHANQKYSYVARSPYSLQTLIERSIIIYETAKTKALAKNR